MSYCVYIIFDPKNNCPRYVGMGSSLLRPYDHLKGSHNLRLSRLIGKRLREGYDIVPLIVTDPMSNLEWANDLEELLITFFGREDLGTGTLFNLTPGRGGGPHSDDTKQRISSLMKGRTFSEEHKEALRIAALKRARVPFTEEHKANISKSRRGAPSPMKGRTHTATARHNMSVSGKNRTYKGRRPVSEETRAKLRAAALGRTPWNKGL